MIFVLGLAVAWITLGRGAFGRKVYVSGAGADVARYSGIDVSWLKLRLFIISSLAAGLAGISSPPGSGRCGAALASSSSWTSSPWSCSAG